MPKFAKYTAPNQSSVYLDLKQVVRISPRLVGGGATLSLSNGQNQDVLEPMEDVLADLEGEG